MPCPKIEVEGRRVIVLSGFQSRVKNTARTGRVVASIDVESVEELNFLAKQHPDAVAFGYVAGRWVPAA